MKLFSMLLAAGSLVVAVGTAATAGPTRVAERWAVLIGIDDYAYAQKLQFCGADQLALSERLIASGFPTDHVFVLHDKTDNPKLRPSHANIERQLSVVLNLAAADDLLIVGFSGHGVHLNGKSFLCPADCSLDDPQTLIGLDGVYERLQQCAASFKLVVVDACRNDPRPGGTRSMTATVGTRALARSLQELQVPEGVVLLNSCAPGEVSWEDDEFGHGVFMHYVLDGLAGAADAGGDGRVSLNELQAFAGTRTKTYVANRFAAAQRPFFKGDLTTEALEYGLIGVPRTAAPQSAASVPPVVPQPVAARFDGTWKSDQYGTCTLTTSGDQIDGRMVYPNGNRGALTAIVSGRSIVFNWANGADEGSGQLTLSADGSTLSGHWASTRSGQRDNWVLKRVR